MNKRTARLIEELRKRHKSCVCGAVKYPRAWMKSTRIKAVQDGLVNECCRDTDTCFVFLKPTDSASEGRT